MTKIWDNIQQIVQTIESQKLEKLTYLQAITLIESVCTVGRQTAQNYLDICIRHGILKRDSMNNYTLIKEAKSSGP